MRQLGSQDSLGEFLHAAAGAATQQGAFDILFLAGLPPMLALANSVVPMDEEPLSSDDVGALVRLLLGFRMGRYRSFDTTGIHEAEFVAQVSPGIRYRISLYRQRGTLAVVLRPVWQSVPPLEALGVPNQISEFLRRRRGLILVAGPSAAGKSTTMSAMVEYINQNMTRHIISIENPVEYVHTRFQSIISQRSVPDDTPSYGAAVRASLRQLPDVLVIGDVRDWETAAAALHAAESGHLVIAAVHSKDSSEAVARLQSFFPAAQRTQVAVQIAGTILAILVQQLLARRADTGRVLATEFLVATAGVRHLIRTGRTHFINTHLQTGRALGMRTMEDSLVEFTRSGIIEYGEALTASPDVGLFFNLLRRRRQTDQGIGRLNVSRRRAVGPGQGSMGLAVPPDATVYRSEMVKAAATYWSSNGLLRGADGALLYQPDPFQPTLYAQVTDYTVWAGKRQGFRLGQFVRLILRARPDPYLRRPAAPPGEVPRCRVWVLVMCTDRTVITLPPEDAPGLELSLDDNWLTLHTPVPPEHEGIEVKSYAVRLSQPHVEFELREVYFG